MSLDDLLTEIDVLDDATAAVVGSARALSDAAVAEPSLLPGWSRGHVLAHLTGNAYALGRLADWALGGAEVPMYASRAARDAEIESLAARPATALRADLEASAKALRDQLAAIADDDVARERVVRLSSGAPMAGREIVSARLVEVIVHHVDLGAGYTSADWTEATARRALDRVVPVFRAKGGLSVGRLVAIDSPRTEPAQTWEITPGGPELSGSAPDLLAWITGRGTGANLLHDGRHGPVPAAPPWN